MYTMVSSAVPNASSPIMAPSLSSFKWMGAIAVVVVLLVLAAVYEPSILLSRTYSSFIFGFIVIALIVARFRRISIGSPDWKAAKYLQTVCILSLLVFGYMLARNNGYLNFISPTYMSYIANAAVALFVLVGLALVYLSVLGMEKPTGMVGFLFDLVFALPCYIIDLARYVLREYDQSTRVVVLLLAIEAAIISAWFVAPMAMRAWHRATDALFGKGSRVILEPLTYLNHQVVIANRFHAQKNTRQDLVPEMRGMGQLQLYSIGLDLYLVPVDIGDDEQSKYSLFRYGPAGSTSGKPAIHYAGVDPTAQKNGGTRGHMLRVVLSNNSSAEPILVSIETQKWNHIQINYANNGADVLVNGELTFHASFAPGELPTFDSNDAFVVGNNSGSALGAVRNVMYHDRPQNVTKY